MNYNTSILFNVLFYQNNNRMKSHTIEDIHSFNAKYDVFDM